MEEKKEEGEMFPLNKEETEYSSSKRQNGDSIKCVEMERKKM